MDMIPSKLWEYSGGQMGGRAAVRRAPRVESSLVRLFNQQEQDTKQLFHMADMSHSLSQVAFEP